MAEQILSADLAIGIDGLFGSKNPAQLPPSALVTADNITYIDGTLKKEGGAVKYNSTAISGSPSILAGFDWWPNTSTQRAVILTSAGSILKDSGTGTFPVTLKSGLSVAAPFGTFVAGGKEAAANNRKLFCFTGTDPVQVLSGDGVTTADISGPPTDWSGSNQPIGGVIHSDRLWGFGNLNDPHRLYYSGTSNHETVSSTRPVYPGVGERILAAFSMRGFIIVFKFPSGIFSIDTRDASDANWRTDKISDDIGIAGIGAAVLAERSIIFMDSGGNLQLIEQVTTDAFGIQNLGNVALIKSFINSNLNLGELDNCKAVFYPKDREIHFAVPHTGSGVNTRRLVVDMNREQMRFRYSTRDIPVSMWRRKVANSPRLAMGDNIGFVWDLDQAIRSKDGAGYNMLFESSPNDLAYIDPQFSGRRKNGKFLEMIFEPAGNHNVSVVVLWDGVAEATYSFDMTGATSGFILGAGILGTGVLGAGAILASIRKRITGSGKRIALRVSNSGADQNISLSKFILHFTLSDQRANI